MESHFDFEKPIAALEQKLLGLRETSQQEGINLAEEIRSLEIKLEKLLSETYAQLSPWQRVQVSRHPNRPYTLDFIQSLFKDFQEIHGDRRFADDLALIGGIALWQPKGVKEPIPVVTLGHQKGRKTKEKMERNFGMARPEGYRKAMRLFDLANRFKMPIITWIDTPGAFPGLDAEERGQAQAIADSIQTMFKLEVPIAAIVIGEGGSGGALAVGVADQVYMLEYSTYSVISPESCASILWNDATLASNASEKLKMGSKELLALEIIDHVIEEPSGGAHRDWQRTFLSVSKSLEKYFLPLVQSEAKATKGSLITRNRLKRFRKLGHNAIEGN